MLRRRNIDIRNIQEADNITPYIRKILGLILSPILVFLFDFVFNFYLNVLKNKDRSLKIRENMYSWFLFSENL